MEQQREVNLKLNDLNSDNPNGISSQNPGLSNLNIEVS